MRETRLWSLHLLAIPIILVLLGMHFAVMHYAPVFYGMSIEEARSFEVMIERNFSSAHQLRGYKGKCENLHGHNYRIEIYARGRELDNVGLLVDFVELKAAADEVVTSTTTTTSTGTISEFAPGSTFAVLITAPMPVVTPQPM